MVSRMCPAGCIRARTSRTVCLWHQCFNQFHAVVVAFQPELVGRPVAADCVGHGPTYLLNPAFMLRCGSQAAVVGMKLKEIGEFGFIDRIAPLGSFRSEGVVKGIGDDCAVISIGGPEHLLVTTDLLVERVHFFMNWASPEVIGAKALDCKPIRYRRMWRDTQRRVRQPSHTRNDGPGMVGRPIPRNGRYCPYL